MQPRSSEASDPRYAWLAWPRRCARGGPCRDFLTGDDLFAFLKPGDDLRIDPVGDPDHDVARFLAPVILHHVHRSRARPQSSFRFVPTSTGTAPASTSATAATAPSCTCRLIRCALLRGL